MTKLIFLRGNSGSGKSTVAKILHEQLGEGAMLVSQDVLRRQMLRVNDRVGSLSIDLNQCIIDFGISNCRYIIIEGIYTNRKHGKWIMDYVHKYESYPYYFKIPFEETLKRHATKENVDFGEREMRSWYLEDDRLNIASETIIDENSLNQIVELIINDVSKK